MELFAKLLKKNSICFAIIVLYMIHAYIILARHNQPRLWNCMDGYVLAHYLISYHQYGLIPRGLIGTGFHYIHPFFSSSQVFMLILELTCGIYCLFLIYMMYIIRKKNYPEILILLFLLFLTNPLSWSSFSDLGRFDIYLLLLTMTAGILLFHAPPWTRFLVPFLIPIGVMIHEAFLFLFIPAIWSWSFLQVRQKQLKSAILPGIILLSIFFSVLLLMTMRQNMPSGTTIHAHLTNATQIFPWTEKIGYDYAGNGDSIRTYKDHFLSVRNWLCKDGNFYAMLLSLLLWALLVYCPMYFLSTLLVQQKDRLGKLQILFLMAAGITPLSLMMIGIDYGRWMAASFWCLILTVFFLYQEREPRFVEPIFIRRKEIVFLIIVCSLTMGESKLYYFNHFTMIFGQKINALIQSLM